MKSIKEVKAAIRSSKTGILSHQLGVVEPFVSKERAVDVLGFQYKQVRTKLEIGVDYDVPTDHRESSFESRLQEDAEAKIMNLLYGDVREKLAKAIHQVSYELRFEDSDGLKMLQELLTELHTRD